MPFKLWDKGVAWPMWSGNMPPENQEIWWSIPCGNLVNYFWIHSEICKLVLPMFYIKSWLEVWMISALYVISNTWVSLLDVSSWYWNTCSFLKMYRAVVTENIHIQLQSLNLSVRNILWLSIITSVIMFELL